MLFVDGVALHFDGGGESGDFVIVVHLVLEMPLFDLDEEELEVAIGLLLVEYVLGGVSLQPRLHMRA